MVDQILEHALVTIRCGQRRHSLRVVFLCGCILVAGAYLAATFASRQPVTMALDVGLSGIRASVTLLALFWVQDLIGRDIDRKSLLWVLTYPTPRAAYLLGRVIGIATLSLVAVAVLGGLLRLVLAAPGIGYTPTTHLALGGPYLLTLAFTVLDIWLVIAFAVLISMFSTTSVMPLLMGGLFAISARSLGSVIAYLKSGEAAGLPHASIKAVDIVSYILPDLSRLDIREICLYRVPLNGSLFTSAAIMAFAYIALLLTMAAWRLNTREFA